MQMQDKIVINDYIENDPLSEENLDKTLETVDRFRLLFPNKTIWLYSGYSWEYLETKINISPTTDEKLKKYIDNDKKRKQIIELCNVLVDGKYIDSQQDITLKWRGSKNQRVIDVQQSLQRKNEGR